MQKRQIKKFMVKFYINDIIYNIYGEGIKITILRNIYLPFTTTVWKSRKKIIEEVSRLMNEWLQDLPLKNIAFKAIMVMLNLLLQKPWQKSKSKNHLSALEKRMELWESGELVGLLKEAETIQKCPIQHQRKIEEIKSRNEKR